MQTLTEIAKSQSLPAQQIQYLQKLESCSPFASRLLCKDADLLKDLLENLHIPYQLAEMQNFLAQQKINDEISLKRALRKLRQRVMTRMIARDLNSLAGFGLESLLEVMQTTSQLAECVINTAIDYLNTWLVDVHGQPVDAQGYPQNLIVIGMGKLGGGELNVSSDIDLIFAYESDGQTQAENPISNQDFFTKLAKKLIAAIDEVTEDGFVFRVDMRLRPFGSEGALVSNLDALEEYYQNNGREWERYAWIKGREVTGGNQVSRLLKPFVFRKYLDFGAFASMRDLKVQIQRDVNSKGMFDNIKLGRGGIREIEFITQVFQLIRGGQDVSLQIKPTLSALNLLKNKGLLSEKTVTELSEAYVFLRNLEHRLMYVEDAQTQELPKTDEAKVRIAQAMGFSLPLLQKGIEGDLVSGHEIPPNPPFTKGGMPSIESVDQGWQAFLAQLNLHRNVVQQHFDATFSEEKAESNALETEKNVWNGVLNEQESLSALQQLGFADTAETLRRIQTLHKSSRYLQLPEASRLRFDALMPHVLSIAAKQPNAEVTLNRMIALLESICRRASYLALLAEHKDALHLLVKLCSSSPWLSQYLTQHPILLDELLDTRTLYAAPDFAAMRAELINRLAEFEGDVERQMDVMRHFKHAYIFRFAAQDINGELNLETLSDYLSALADLILSVSLTTIWPNVRGKHCDVPKFAVIGYGKLGGKELGYASDLDIIFLYDDDAPEAGEVYARFAQRINNWFNSLTSAGLLYETDLQLRPDGNSGLLVSSVAAFREYQRNKAWVWEHQALTRARFVAGDANIGAAFEQIRIEVITQRREAALLKTEILNMREKMRAAQRIPADKFDIKHSVGGIVDVEFLVQHYVMYYANKYSQLSENIGNIALLKMLGELGLIDKTLAQKVAQAFRTYRQQQHLLKLQGATHIQVDVALVVEHVQAVKSLWQAVFTEK